jgi:hypothetical protein
MTTIKEKAVAAISRPETGIVFGVISLVGLYFKSVAIELKWGACPAFMPAGCALAVLHGDPAKPNADVFLRVPGNTTIPEHWHTSAERMILVSGELAVRYQKQPEVVLKPGMYAYGPAKLPHTASCRGTAPCVLFIAFESAVDAVPVSTPPK